VQLDEWLEYALQSLGGDSDSGVAHRNRHSLVTGADCGQLNAPAGRCVPDGVGQQVEQDLPQLLPVGKYGECGVAGEVSEVQRLGGHLRFNQRIQAGEELVQRYGREFVRDPPGLDAAEVQHAADQSEQVLLANLDPFEVAMLLLAYGPAEAELQ